MGLAVTLTRDMATSTNRRHFEEERAVRYLTTDNEFVVEVARTLQKWCVTVYQADGRTVITQDFFPERWKALARAQDFVRLLNQRKRQRELEAGVEAEA